MRFAPHRALLLGIAASAFLLVELQACSSGDDPRKGGVGESCTRTDDCAEPLACIEAMKMEMWVTAAAAGRVLRVVVGEGTQVAAQSLLVELEIV